MLFVHSKIKVRIKRGNLSVLFIVTQIFYSDSFSFTLRKSSFLYEFYFGSYQYLIFELPGYLFSYFLQFDVTICREVAEFYFDNHLVLIVYRIQSNEVVAAKLGELNQYFSTCMGKILTPLMMNISSLRPLIRSIRR